MSRSPTAPRRRLGRLLRSRTRRCLARWGLLAVASGAAFSALRAAPARACVQVEPGIYDRLVWPGIGPQPPTNARFVISYGSRWDAADPGVPPIGPDVVLMEGNGTPVPSTFEQTGAQVILSPSQELLPNSLYRLADRRLVPCVSYLGQCALLDAPVIFASFTTAAVADSRPPTFAGLTSLTVQPRMSGESSCGAFDYYPLDLAWGAGGDDVAGHDVRYRLYRALPGAPGRTVAVTPLLDRTQLSAVQTCRVDPDFYTNLGAGSYQVRAVDWAGNEDGNTEFRRLDSLCGGWGCAVAAPSGVGGAPGRGGLAALVASLVVALAYNRRRSRM
jgi:hypothetical protein